MPIEMDALTLTDMTFAWKSTRTVLHISHNLDSLCLCAQSDELIG